MTSVSVSNVDPCDVVAHPAQEVEGIDSPAAGQFIEGDCFRPLSAQKDHLVSNRGAGRVGQVDPHVFEVDGTRDGDAPSTHQGRRVARNVLGDAVAPTERQDADSPALSDREWAREASRILQLDPFRQDQSRLPGTHGGAQREVPPRLGRRLEAVEDAAGVDAVQVHLRMLQDDGRARHHANRHVDVV